MEKIIRNIIEIFLCRLLRLLLLEYSKLMMNPVTMYLIQLIFFLFLLTAQAMISPSIGKLMDYLAHNHFDGKPNYLIPFIGHDVFLILCIINVFCIKLEVDLPKSSGMKGLKKIFGNLDICFFLAVMFVLGKEICLKKV